jgi:hypothetical protein
MNPFLSIKEALTLKAILVAMHYKLTNIGESAAVTIQAFQNQPAHKLRNTPFFFSNGYFQNAGLMACCFVM